MSASFDEDVDEIVAKLTGLDSLHDQTIHQYGLIQIRSDRLLFIRIHSDGWIGLVV
jgi:hypothetical protein